MLFIYNLYCDRVIKHIYILANVSNTIFCNYNNLMTANSGG